MKGLFAAATLVATAISACGSWPLGFAAAQPAAKPAPPLPVFEVDPNWPKMPTNFRAPFVSGITIDPQGNGWLTTRPARAQGGDDKIVGPPIMIFDPNGGYIRGWGGPGPGYEWPASEHNIFIDHKGYVWVSGDSCKGQTSPADDDQVLKFTQDGKFLMQIGKPGRSKGSNDVENLRRPAKIFVDQQTNEAYVADGYGNHRVIVFDAETGKYKRHWGAYGHKPDDVDQGRYDPNAPPAQQFRNPVHCADLSVDRLLYVCDRVNDRLQVFKPDGTFVKEAFYEKQTLGSGSAWDIAFSKDPQQKYIYLADGENDRVHIVDRSSLEVLTTFGEGGRQPGEFYGVHSIATDSKGNIYTTETYRGQRVQRFVYKGLAAVTKADQGVLWPKSGGK